MKGVGAVHHRLKSVAEAGRLKPAEDPAARERWGTRGRFGSQTARPHRAACTSTLKVVGMVLVDGTQESGCREVLQILLGSRSLTPSSGNKDFPVDSSLVPGIGSVSMPEGKLGARQPSAQGRRCIGDRHAPFPNPP